ncbi:MAG: thermonuclease family protein [Oscillatoriales cyanobacterium]|nr:MAG: thermonuclease family protein [Oscillatoriales cyanobacterium]
MNHRSQLERWRPIAYVLWCAIAGYWQLVPRPQAEPPGTIAATVTRVVSGQTIEVRLDHAANQTETIRLAGIDAPDLRQSPWGLNSQQALAQQIEGQRVNLEWDRREETGQPERDRFGRLHAWVWSEGELVQATVLRSGWSLVQATEGDSLPDSWSRSTLQAAETEARSLGRGLWSAASALRQHPADFRSER